MSDLPTHPFKHSGIDVVTFANGTKYSTRVQNAFGIFLVSLSPLQPLRTRLGDAAIVRVVG